MKQLLRKAIDFWAVRSFLLGSVSTAVDVGTVLVGVQVLGLPPVPCVAAGVVVGAVVSFLLNKYVAFRDRTSPILPQALRYGTIFGAELILHTALNNALIHGFGVPYLISKFACDFLVFTCLHLLLMRFVVFVGKGVLARKPEPAAVEPEAPEAVRAP